LLSGKSIALRLANDGYDICINDISANKQGAEEVAHEITQLGRKSTVAIGDVSVMSEVESVVQQSVNELGPLSTMFAIPPDNTNQKKKKNDTNNKN
jgi:NAD(P)-dependent dehydrogenase (short-subunit alcohol dehydrogenase family)